MRSLDLRPRFRGDSQGCHVRGSCGLHSSMLSIYSLCAPKVLPMYSMQCLLRMQVRTQGQARSESCRSAVWRVRSAMCGWGAEPRQGRGQNRTVVRTF